MKKIILLAFTLLFASFLVPAQAEMIILRPNATIKAASTQVGCTSGAQWDCLDEVNHDSATSAVAITTDILTAFDFNDTKDYISGGLPSGARINWVMATGVLRDGTGTAGANNGFLRLNISRSIYNTSDLNPGAAWVEYNHTNYTTNPKTGVAWTLADVDSLKLDFDGTGDVAPPPNATQLSIKVGYTPVLTANASFGSGALATVQTNSSTQLGTITSSNILFNGTCNVNGGTSDVALYVQDNSSGSWANTSGTPADINGAFVYANRTVYNLTSVSGTSGNMFFNITVTNKTAAYGLRIQCNGPNAVPSWANSTVGNNLTVLFPVEANASFLGSGATSSVNINGTTDCAASNPTCSHAMFNGTCIAKGANSNSRTFRLYVQDNSSGSWANTTGAAGALIYTNRTAYNVTTTTDNSGNMLFNITVTNKTAEYGLRIQCSVGDGAPTWQNSTVETNMSVIIAPEDSCTPTADADWVLSCADNCQLHNKHYSVKKINVTGTGVTLFSASSINYTQLNFATKTCKLIFNGTFAFRRRPLA